MRKHATDDGPEDAPLPIPADGEKRSVSIAVEIVPTPDGTTECTLFPADASGIELMTTWITAGEDSFVALDEMQ